MEAIGTEAAGVVYVVAGELMGIEPDRLPASPMPPAPLLQEGGDRGNAARFALPMAIFCGILLSSLSLAIGIGYKRRFDALAATAESDSETGEPEAVR